RISQASAVMLPPFLRWTMSARAAELRNARHRASEARARSGMQVRRMWRLPGRSQSRQRHDERPGLPDQGRWNRGQRGSRRVRIVVKTPADAVAGTFLERIRKDEQRGARAGARARGLHGLLLAGD